METKSNDRRTRFNKMTHRLPLPAFIGLRAKKAAHFLKARIIAVSGLRSPTRIAPPIKYIVFMIPANRDLARSHPFGFLEYKTYCAAAFAAQSASEKQDMPSCVPFALVIIPANEQNVAIVKLTAAIR